MAISQTEWILLYLNITREMCYLCWCSNIFHQNCMNKHMLNIWTMIIDLNINLETLLIKPAVYKSTICVAKKFGGTQLVQSMSLGGYLALWSWSYVLAQCFQKSTRATPLAIVRHVVAKCQEILAYLYMPSHKRHTSSLGVYIYLNKKTGCCQNHRFI